MKVEIAKVRNVIIIGPTLSLARNPRATQVKNERKFFRYQPVFSDAPHVTDSEDAFDVGRKST